MQVRVDDPEALQRLMAELLRSDCVAQEIGPIECRVLHIDAHDGDEAWRELEFFLRAWQSRNPDVAVAFRLAETDEGPGWPTLTA